MGKCLDVVPFPFLLVRLSEYPRWDFVWTLFPNLGERSVGPRERVWTRTRSHYSETCFEYKIGIWIWIHSHSYLSAWRNTPDGILRGHCSPNLGERSVGPRERVWKRTRSHYSETCFEYKIGIWIWTHSHSSLSAWRNTPDLRMNRCLVPQSHRGAGVDQT
jgi:hypothetical protein